MPISTPTLCSETGMPASLNGGRLKTRALLWQGRELVGGQNGAMSFGASGSLTRIVWNLRSLTGGRSLRRTNSRSPRQACVNSSLDSLAMCTLVIPLAARLYLAAETDALEDFCGDDLPTAQGQALPLSHVLTHPLEVQAAPLGSAADVRCSFVGGAMASKEAR